jgi:pyruvate/2-oxoacid:ferredoxin oxidoreductase alpha subunit
MAKELIKGNTAVAEAALRAGLEAYFGYPITPQTELLEHLSARMPELGRLLSRRKVNWARSIWSMAQPVLASA